MVQTLDTTWQDKISGERGRRSQGNPYAVNTSDTKDPYSIGFDATDGDAAMSYYDIRLKELEEFKAKAEDKDSRILPNGALVDEYSTDNALLLSVHQSNGYSYNVLVGKNKHFDYSVNADGAFIRTDKRNHTSMSSIKVEGNRWYKDVSNFEPSATVCTVSAMRDGKISTQIQKDGRIAIERIIGKVESHSFFIKTRHGAILTVDENGSLIFADSRQLPKDIPEQDRAIHAQFEAHPELIRGMVAPPVSIAALQQEYGVKSNSLEKTVQTLKKNGVAHVPGASDFQTSHTAILAEKTSQRSASRNPR